MTVLFFFGVKNFDIIFIKPVCFSNSFQPRLGPKPFSSGNSTEFSFDKVFSVPQVPGQETIEATKEIEEKAEVVSINRPPYLDEVEEELAPIQKENEEEEILIQPKEEQIEFEVEKPITPVIEEAPIEFRRPKTDEEIFKQPSTAERRKVSAKNSRI